MIKKIKPWVNIVMGCTVMAAGFVYFINPYNIVPGGSVVLLGAKLGVRTIVAALLTPLIMNGLSIISYPSREALEMLDPSQLLGGVVNLSDQLMLTSVPSMASTRV